MSYRVPKASDKTFIVAKPSENPVKSTGLASKTSSKAETSEKEEVGFFDWFFNSGGSLPDDDDTPPSQRAASYYSSPEASTSADTEMGTDEPEGFRALTPDPEPASSWLRNPFEALFADVTPFDMEEEALRSSEEASLYRMERGITDAKGSLGDIITQDIEDRASEEEVVSPIHKVVSGDTLSKIARANDTTVAAILTANPDIKNPNKISVGQDIVLPSAEPVEEATPATTQGAGLMSPDTATAESNSSFTSNFVTAMGSSEGTEDHVDHLGITTLAYGILPATAKKLGFDPDSEKYTDRKVLAEAVYGKMYDNAQAAYPDVFEGLTDSQKTGTLSLYINLGKLPSGVVTALSEETPDFDAAKTSLASVVLGSPRNADSSRKKDANGNTIYTSSKGLSKRRAKEYNTLMQGSDDFKPVKTISVEGTRAAPIFVWKDADGTEIHRHEPSITGENKVYHGLDTKSSLTDVTL